MQAAQQESTWNGRLLRLAADKLQPTDIKESLMTVVKTTLQTETVALVYEKWVLAYIYRSNNVAASIYSHG